MRRKSDSTVNLRIDRKLRHELETAAQEHGLTLSQEIRTRLKGFNLIRNSSVKRSNKAVPDAHS